MGRQMFIIISVLLLALVGTGASVATTAAAQSGDGYPARIQTGSCTDIGEDVFALTGVGATVSIDGAPVPDVEFLGADIAIPLMASVTTVPGASITALTDEPHVIAIYASDDASDEIVACGTIGGILARQMSGMIMPGDALQIGLGSANDSGFAGIATMQSEEGGKLLVVILLAPIARALPSAATPVS